MKKTIYLTLFFLFIAQIIYTQGLPKAAFLDEIKADSIIPAKGLDLYEYKLVRSSRNGKWGVYNIEQYEGFVDEDAENMAILYDVYRIIIPMKFDSLSFNNEGISNEVVVVKNRGKYGLLKNFNYYREDSWKDVKCKYDKIIIKQSDIGLHALFKEKGKWGLLNWRDGRIIFDPLFEKASDVPLYTVEDWTLDLMIRAKKKLKADLILMDFNNSDGVFKARIKKTSKWGMYQSYNSKVFKELIPPNYDSINFFRFNYSFTTVYNDGKVGVYTSKWSYEEEAKETVKCKYEDYKLFKADGRIKLALKRDGYWGWIDYYTGEEKSEFKYDTPDDLPYPHFKQ